MAPSKADVHAMVTALFTLTAGMERARRQRKAADQLLRQFYADQLSVEHIPAAPGATAPEPEPIRRGVHANRRLLRTRWPSSSVVHRASLTSNRAPFALTPARAWNYLREHRPIRMITSLEQPARR